MAEDIVSLCVHALSKGNLCAQMLRDVVPPYPSSSQWLATSAMINVLRPVQCPAHHVTLRVSLKHLLQRFILVGGLQHSSERFWLVLQQTATLQLARSHNEGTQSTYPTIHLLIVHWIIVCTVVSEDFARLM
jgi:hypothetical protein